MDDSTNQPAQTGQPDVDSVEVDLYAIYTPPENGETTAYKFKELPSDLDEGDLPHDAIIITTLPPLPDPKGPRTECIIFPQMRDGIEHQEEFPQPLDDPPEILYEVKEVPGKGLGMFATKDIKAGHQIFSERPLLLARPMLHIYNAEENMTPEEVKALGAPEYEAMLQVAFKRMTKENQEIYMALSNCHKDEDKYPLLGIFRTNGYSVEDRLHKLLRGLPFNINYQISGVCTLLSRINHSCAANANRTFDPIMFAFQLCAARDIPAGEEITLSYCNTLIPTAERQALLDSYGFKCSCPACLNPAVSDEKREKILALPSPNPNVNFKDAAEGWINNPSLPDDQLIRQSLEAIALLESEGLEASDLYRYHRIQMAMAFAALGEEKLTRISAHRAGMSCNYLGDEGLTMMLGTMLFEPTKSPLWGKRLKLENRVTKSQPDAAAAS